jgi:hypothetical protein
MTHSFDDKWADHNGLLAAAYVRQQAVVPARFRPGSRPGERSHREGIRAV